MKKIKCLTILLSGMLFFGNVAAQEKLIFAADLFRHGDRTAILHNAENLAMEPFASGQLTPQGMRQLFEAGVQLRKKYMEHYRLLPADYSGDSFYVRSSDFNRTLMSAQSFLMGFYPPGTGPYLPDTTKPALPAAFQPIPIHTVPRQQDTLLVTENKSPGQELPGLIAQYMKLAAEHKTALKYMLFVGHDVSISKAVRSLHASLQQDIPYAACLNFSLFENEKKYYVKISFNDEPVFIPGCATKGVCSFEKFLVVVSLRGNQT